MKICQRRWTLCKRLSQENNNSIIGSSMGNTPLFHGFFPCFKVTPKFPEEKEWAKYTIYFIVTYFRNTCHILRFEVPRYEASNLGSTSSGISIKARQGPSNENSKKKWGPETKTLSTFKACLNVPTKIVDGWDSSKRRCKDIISKFKWPTYPDLKYQLCATTLSKSILHLTWPLKRNKKTKTRSLGKNCIAPFFYHKCTEVNEWAV